ncbi:MAG: tRNA 2-thiocytidine biosynthesis TtcA family protein [Bacteroidaceae bacterium]|nr:tRNA 2-thiocytidine biosynthesis TtcA family protein [Bacteroidaceae bacterium]
MINEEKEKKALEKRLLRSLRTASARYDLIADGDRILVGLSGGKDSLCLLRLLALQSRILRPSFSVEALHVRMEEVQYETDLSYLRSFCEQLNVPLHVVTASFTQSSQTTRSEKPVCFLCSWNRRKQLFNFAQDHGFNKIALGHHQDDLLHTALMNLTFQGHFSTMPARLEMRKMPLAIIRPLCAIQETDIQQYATLYQFLPLVKRCPFEHDSQRTAARHLFNELEKMNPEARYSLWHAIEAAGKLVES